MKSLRGCGWRSMTPLAQPRRQGAEAPKELTQLRQGAKATLGKQGPLFFGENGRRSTKFLVFVTGSRALRGPRKVGLSEERLDVRTLVVWIGKEFRGLAIGTSSHPSPPAAPRPGRQYEPHHPYAAMGPSGQCIGRLPCVLSSASQCTVPPTY